MKNKSTECSLRQVHAVVVLNSQVSHRLYMCRNVLISVIDFSSYTGLFILVNNQIPTLFSLQTSDRIRGEP